MRLVRQIETAVRPAETRSGAGAAAKPAIDGWAWASATYTIER